LKILVLGLGSMGKRRIRNLQELKINDIVGYDINQERCKEAKELYKIEIAENLDIVLDEKLDGIIISTPPDKHKEHASIAIEREIPFFTEVNTMNPDDMQDIINLCKKNNVKGMPSCNIIFHPSVIKIKEKIEQNKIGEILTFNYHSGTYLPDWHPWEKLSDYYVFKKETGGGRDQIMWEFPWIYQILGKPCNISAFTKKKGKFEADIFDVYDLLIEFKNGVIGHIMVDVIQRPQSRFCEIIGTSGTIRWEYDNKKVTVYDAENKTWENYPESEDYQGFTEEVPKPGFSIKDKGLGESYIDEMKCFLKMIKEEEDPSFTLEDEKILLKTMYLAEKSSKDGIHLKIES
jgi:predicted dehydrogenase